MADKTPIRIMIVDDHLMVRRGLEIMIQAAGDLELVAEAADGNDAVRLCGDVMPDVVLMDMIIPGLGGAAATRAIREQYPGVQVLALTSYAQQDLVHDALRAGAWISIWVMIVLRDGRREPLSWPRPAAASRPPLSLSLRRPAREARGRRCSAHLDRSRLRRRRNRESMRSRGCGGVRSDGGDATIQTC